MDLSLTVCLTILSNRQLLELVEVRSEMHCTTQLLVTSCSYAHLFGEVTKRALYLVKSQMSPLPPREFSVQIKPVIHGLWIHEFTALNKIYQRYSQTRIN